MAIVGIGDLSTIIDQIVILQQACDSSDAVPSTYIDKLVQHLSRSKVSRSTITNFTDFLTLKQYDSDAMQADIEQGSSSNIAVHIGDKKADRALIEYLQVTDELLSYHHETRTLLTAFCQARESTIYIQSESELPSEIRAALLHDKA
eukprot:816158_1